MLEFAAFELLSQCGYSKTCAEQESEPLLLRVWNFGIMDRTVGDVEDGSNLNFEETSAGIDFPGVRRSTRVRVPTDRGLDFQLTLKRKNYNQ